MRLKLGRSRSDVIVVVPHEKRTKLPKGRSKAWMDEMSKGEGFNQKFSDGDFRYGDLGQKLGVGNMKSSQIISSADKRSKSLPPAETLPRHDTLGGYIFACNNDTMAEDLKRELFGLPQGYQDSVRSIQPGLP